MIDVLGEWCFLGVVVLWVGVLFGLVFEYRGEK